jgi:hypothetical protein
VRYAPPRVANHASSFVPDREISFFYLQVNRLDAGIRFLTNRFQTASLLILLSIREIIVQRKKWAADAQR